jgi:hypothetical protein
MVSLNGTMITMRPVPILAGGQASTHPHHKHVPPNIKRNRIPAHGISFTAPNLPQIIQELEELMGEIKQDEALKAV